ncbi:MAG: 50S ribosomal protein L21 [Candidatus Buchananbacteria bacterium]
MSLAVIKTGGKQYLVKPGSKLKIEKLELNAGDKVSFDTLLTADEEGAKIEIGKPTLSVKTEAKVLAQGKAKKVLVVKYKAKIRYKKRVGHRQPFTQVEISK